MGGKPITAIARDPKLSPKLVRNAIRIFPEVQHPRRIQQIPIDRARNEQAFGLTVPAVGARGALHLWRMLRA